MIIYIHMIIYIMVFYLLIIVSCVYYILKKKKHKQYLEQFNHENICIKMKYIVTFLLYLDDFSLETFKLYKILIK